MVDLKTAWAFSAMSVGAVNHDSVSSGGGGVGVGLTGSECAAALAAVESQYRVPLSAVAGVASRQDYKDLWALVKSNLDAYAWYSSRTMKKADAAVKLERIVELAVGQMQSAIEYKDSERAYALCITPDSYRKTWKRVYCDIYSLLLNWAYEGDRRFFYELK